MPSHHTIPSSSREQPSHFDNGGGMHSESQYHLEPSVSVSSLLPTQGDALITTNFVGECFQRNMDEIWTWLIDDDVTRIGIWGMAGVGKTELAKHVHNKLLQIPNQFDHVYWVTVSPDFTVHKLQDSFGKSLGLDLSHEEDQHKRAAKLLKALNGSGGCKKCVFILDDVWNYLPLYDRVGIPASTKLIFTSRSLDVCRMIRCQKKIKIKPLSHEDGWELFKQILGQEEEALSPEILKLARLVSDRCDGLPLAIIWISISMREVDDKASWENGLEKLRKSTMWQQNTEVFQRLKLSYDYLNDSALQQCFLYCAFYQRQGVVRKEALMVHLIDEGIIRPKRSIMAEHVMLKKLENVCLLDDVGFLAKMNLVTCDLAYQVLRASGTTMAEFWAEFEELPDLEEWRENLVRVLLTDNDMVEIPSSYTPRCPNLLMLLLDDNMNLERIANSFFGQFHKLKFLNLSRCDGIEKLPDSVSNLVNLTTLLLFSCLNLHHVPSLAKLGELKMLVLFGCPNIKEMPEGVGSLSKLEYLDISGTGIEEMPEGVGSLSELAYLDLSGTRIKEMPEGVGSLSKLEYLDISGTGIKEMPEGVGSLSKLEYLDISGTGIKEMPEGVGSLSKLECLDISGTGIEEMPEGVGSLSELAYLDLSGTRIKEMPEGVGSLSKLENLDISGTRIEEMPEGVGSLSKLNHLYLDGTRIEEMPEGVGSLSELTHLDLSGTRIKEMPEGVGSLSKLEYLDISKTGIEEMPEGVGSLSKLWLLNISKNGIKEMPKGVGSLSKLKYLDLSRTGIEEMPEGVGSLSKLQYLDISGTRIEDMPEGVGSLSKLEYLDISGTRIEEMPEGVGSLSKLEYLDISGSRIEEIPSGIIANLSGLQVLKLINVDEGYVRAVEVEERELGRLRGLEILECNFQQVSEFMEYMESRRACGKSLSDYTFLIGNFDSLPCGYANLRVVYASVRTGKQVLIHDCNIQDCRALPLDVLSLLISECQYNQKLERIGNSFFEQFHELEVLVVWNCSEIEKFPDSIGNLLNLTTLLLCHCVKLRHVPSLAKLGELKLLSLYGCRNVEEMPEGVGSLSKLEHLDISKTGIEEMPEGVGSLSKLWLLSISKNGIKEMPKGVGSLSKLKYLDLSRTGIEEMPEGVGSLSELKHLDISGTRIEEMPEGVGSLSKLKYLDLSGTEIEEIPSRIIANLSGLQVLKLINVDEGYVRAVEVKERELGRLRELEILECHFQQVSEFLEYMESRRECGKSLSEYTFLIGELDSLAYGYSWKSSKAVWILECHDIKDISTLKLNNTTQLEYIGIGKCEGIENLVSWSQDCNTVKSLQYLKLYDLDNLRGLIKREETITSPTSSQFLSNLKTIHINDCHRVEILFPPNLLPNLHNVQRIKVRKCDGMREIFAIQEEADNINNHQTSMSPFNLPNLTHLVLKLLPELRSIYNGVVNCHSLQEMKLIRCPKLNSIPLPFPQPNSLRTIQIYPQEWWESLRWDNPDHKSNLQTLCVFQEGKLFEELPS